MEVPDYLTIVEIAIAMTLGADGLFVGIMLRARGLYHASWTDAPPGIEQQLQDGQDNFFATMSAVTTPPRSIPRTTVFLGSSR